MKTLFLNLLTFTLFLSFTQKSQAQIDGIGIIDDFFIITDLEFAGVSIEAIQPFELELYMDKNHPSEHLFKVHKNENGREVHYDVVDKKGNKEFLKTDKAGLFWHGLKKYSVQFYSEEEGFLAIKLNDNSYWVKTADLENKGLKHITWANFFKNKPQDIVALYNLNLRDAPNKNGQKIGRVGINNDELSPFQVMQFTGQFADNWAEVVVQYWTNNESYCESAAPFQKLTGWIKHLDDSGFPNVVNNLSLCVPK